MTELELANKLKEMYNSYEKPCGVHLFGIKYADEIAKHNSKLSPIVDSIVEQAGIPDSYGTEVKKGIKIARHLPSIDINLASSSRNQRPKSDIITKIPPLNQILYGPPGTGKTYSTIDKALEILGYAESDDNGKVILDYTKIKQKLQNIADNNKSVGLDLENLNSKNDRELAKLLFDYYRSAEHNKEQKQIEFVTFHQSFSYEEFVEGIKPNVENENAEMTYEVKDGIFKDISENALSNYQAYKDSLQTLPQQQISTKELFQAFAQNLQEQLVSAENGIDFNTPSLSTKMRISKIFYLKNEEAKSIYISVPNAESGQTLKRDIVLRDYEKFKSGEISSYKDIKPTYESLAQ